MAASIFRLAKANFRSLLLGLNFRTNVNHSTVIQNINKCFIKTGRWQREKCTTKMENVRIVDYDFVKNIAKEPNTILIDVRRPEEIKETGLIPSSINIPLDELEKALGPATSNDKFSSLYGIQKPGKNMQIVFTCRSGKRAKESAQKAQALGYTNAAYYEGSWLEWEKCTR